MHTQTLDNLKRQEFVAMQQQAMQEMSLETFTDTFPMFTNRKLRIDTKSQMICVLEVIQLVSGRNQSDASTFFRRLEEKFKTTSNTFVEHSDKMTESHNRW